MHMARTHVVDTTVAPTGTVIEKMEMLMTIILRCAAAFTKAIPNANPASGVWAAIATNIESCAPIQQSGSSRSKLTWWHYRG